MAAVAAVALAACGGSAASTGGRDGVPAAITVAAASDLRPAFEELGEVFTARTGTAVTFSFGSSGQLREQVLNGAPFDLFASANGAYVDEVVAAGRGRADTRADYAEGRIVLYSRDASLRPDSVADLADGRYRRIAIANPEHAPYGLAARQALESAGAYGAVADRLVYGESIADTFQIARSGNADVGIVALSLAVADGVAHTPVPADLHEPLRQALVVTGDGARGEAAAAFADLVSSPAGREVMVRYGFVLPGEEAPG
ncbi:MAG TPA: molybdate ABC transporter substrate-binding protein [Acidimicrobiales bacterium]